MTDKGMKCGLHSPGQKLRTLPHMWQSLIENRILFHRDFEHITEVTRCSAELLQREWLIHMCIKDISDIDASTQHVYMCPALISRSSALYRTKVSDAFKVHDEYTCGSPV